jgi:hypothetical protein
VVRDWCVAALLLGGEHDSPTKSGLYLPTLAPAA